MTCGATARSPYADRLRQDEVVVAVGRCADIFTTGELDDAGAAWTFVMVTDRRVLWVPDMRTSEKTCSLALDDVPSCTEVLWRHRSGLVMLHDPVIRPHFAPNGRPLNWHYLAMDVVLGEGVDVALLRTVLGVTA
jgi:hypothetical protein